MQEFFEKLSTKPGMVTYGEEETLNALNMGAVDKLLISEVVAADQLIELENKSEEFGSEVKVISTETREGVQLKDIGKIAAILRYDMKT